MKNILTIIFVLFTGLQVVAQEENQLDENKVYSFVQKKAEPKEGIAEFYKKFSENFKTITKPDSTKEFTFRLQFIIEKDGSFSDVLINVGASIGVAGKIDEETKRIVLAVFRAMPKWKPAVHNGKIVRSVFTLPMKLQIDEMVYNELKNGLHIDNKLFEFKSKCGLITTQTHEANINEKYKFRCAEGYYQIIISKIDKNFIKTTKSRGIDEGALSKSISFLGNDAIEKSFYSPYVGYGHIRMIELYKNEYFIVLVAASKKSDIADKLIQDLKQAFILKI